VSHEGSTGMSPGRTVGVLAGGAQHISHAGPARPDGHRLLRAEEIPQRRTRAMGAIWSKGVNVIESTRRRGSSGGGVNVRHHR
jgi:hypothetical protein